VEDLLPAKGAAETDIVVEDLAVELVRFPRKKSKDTH